MHVVARKDSYGERLRVRTVGKEAIYSVETIGSADARFSSRSWNVSSADLSAALNTMFYSPANVSENATFTSKQCKSTGTKAGATAENEPSEGFWNQRIEGILNGNVRGMRGPCGVRKRRVSRQKLFSPLQVYTE